MIPICLLTYRHMCEDKRRQKLSGLLHLGLLRASPHALSPHFIPEVPQSLKHSAADAAERADNKESRVLAPMSYRSFETQYKNNNSFYS